MSMRKLIFGLLIAGLVLPVAASAASRDEGARRLAHATRVLHEIMDTPDKAIPHHLLASARCIGIIPGEEKVAFFFGEKGGKGVVVCRKHDGGWGDPVFVGLAGGSFGPQIGISSTDVVMLFMNEHAAARLLSDKFALGGDASIAAGPVGRDAAAGSDVSMQAEILTYARTHGVFAGASLEGATVHAQHDDDKDMYGTASRERILHGEVPQPEEAQPLIRQLDEYSR